MPPPPSSPSGASSAAAAAAAPAATELPLAQLARAPLPPGGSTDAAFYHTRAAPRAAYACATLVTASALAASEASAVTRPFTRALPGYRHRALGSLPQPLALSYSAMLSAAAVLRELWDRQVLLRTALAHVCAVTMLAFVARLDALAVEVTLPRRGGGGVEAFTVDLPADTVVARYLGVLLARLNGGVLEEGGSSSGGGGGGGGSGAHGAHGAHGLVRAVERRLRGAEVRRAEDGIVLHCIDVEHL